MESIQTKTSLPRVGLGLVNGTKLNAIIDAINGTSLVEMGENGTSLRKSVPIKIKTIIGTARYTGQAYIDEARAEPATNLVEADLGEAPTKDNCEVWNLDELSGGSSLTLEKFVAGTLYSTREDGTPVFLPAVAGSFPTPQFTGMVLGSPAMNVLGAFFPFVQIGPD